MSERLVTPSGSAPENLFIELFSDAFGAEKSAFLYPQYHFTDIYQNDRYADFFLENGGKRIAIEIDDEASHNPSAVSRNKFYDDLLKQNSMIFKGWDVYRWAVRQLQVQPDTVKDELRIFLGSHPLFREIADYLPTQRSKTINAENLQLKEHQLAALKSLEEMRERHETIALLYHATGTGKTVTAVSDAKRFGKRTLFLAHTIELVNQAYETFNTLWDGVYVGKFGDAVKERDAYIVCGSIQSVALNLEMFRKDEFEYLIIDEAHHASADTYQKVLAYFKHKFTLGLTATPERADDKDIIEIFKNTAHKLDIQTAVEIGELVPVRCIRIHTNIDLTKVRFNSVQYNIRDLESKIFVPERNTLIVDTFMEYVSDKRTVIFCASVKHAEQIAAMIRERGVAAAAVSGSMKSSERKEMLVKFQKGEIKAMCACDLLNEGWDCPETEVLFMARPTMSKVLYTQQLGRGMRLADGKDFLMVFDFVDNASQYNMPYSLHRLFKLKKYQPGQTVLGKDRAADEALYERGEKPKALIDYPVSVTDYEAVDVFNWQEEAAGMISQMEFIRRVDVQSETVERYIREGKIIPDLIVPMSEHKQLKYFTKETLEAAAKANGWKLINDSNRKELFMEMVGQMEMSYSYKPVLLKAIFAHADNKGRVKLDDISAYFRSFYEERRSSGLVVEKPNSIFAKGGYTDKEAQRNILSNPFKRFEDMQMLRHTKTLGIIEVEPTVWKNLTDDEIRRILDICDEKLERYYGRFEKK
ncbi:DEAD/DEAH box helicase [Ruminococcus sp.]|uniref:DEAD/DEAH box helicase n=1 Tax=Ruminococcus sp. TaxID=41978 RepID=UPI00258E3AEF|nr:DEAD/DEAH box helicase [Ruminococcus sp.]MCR5022213.1 DEAD/DEAH box helicase [Ruminococcus sp.]